MFERSIIVDPKGKESMRKRACVNCDYRNYVTPSRCGFDGHSISYMDVWDGWCRHWKKENEDCYEFRQVKEAQ